MISTGFRVLMKQSSSISIIVAIGEGNRVIGSGGKIPWHIPDDMRWFRQHTLGHPVIMGKNTFFSIGKALPHRTNIVLSDTPWDDAPEEIVVAFSVEEAIKKAKEAVGGEDIFVIGGGEVYKQALVFADRLYVTLVEGLYAGDVFFPEYESLFTRVVSREYCEMDGYRYSFLIVEKATCFLENVQSKKYAS